MNSPTRLKNWVLASLLTFVGVASTHAGHESSGGGGDAFICDVSQKGVPGKKVKMYFADTYKLMSSRDAAELSWAPFQAVWSAIFRTLNDKLPGAGSYALGVARKLKFVPAPRQRYQKVTSVPNPLFPLELPDLPDDYISRAPKNCQKTQLGVQNWKTGLVEFNAVVLNELTPAERAFFFFHETMIWIRQREGDTLEVRYKVKDLAESNAFWVYFRDELERRKLIAPSSARGLRKQLHNIYSGMTRGRTDPLEFYNFDLE